MKQCWVPFWARTSAKRACVNSQIDWPPVGVQATKRAHDYACIWHCIMGTVTIERHRACPLYNLHVTV